MKPVVSDPVADGSKRHSSAWAVLLAFLRLGLTSYGGPIADLGCFRAGFVERRAWLDDRSFPGLVALCRKTNAIAAVALALGAGGALAHGDAVQAGTHRRDAGMVEDTAFGRAGDPKAVGRTVEIVASDAMRFTPDVVRIERGQTVRFIVRNPGHLLHEMVLGTADALEEHAALMRRYPNMEHAAPNMTHVKPGAKGEIVWQFTHAGEFRFACLQPGHFEAGMIGTVVVK